MWKLSKETFSLTFGYEDMGGKEVFREQETKMITGDENIILADLEVQWKIVDPLAFFYIIPMILRRYFIILLLPHYVL